MRRRNFIAAGVGLSLTTLGGCLGRKLVAQRDWDEKNQKLTEIRTSLADSKEMAASLEDDLERQRQTVIQQQTELESRAKKIATLESDVDALEVEVSQLETARAETTKQIVLDWYEVGYDFYLLALADYNDASDRYDAESYATASQFWARANGTYNRAERAFKEAMAAADKYGFDTVSDYAESSMNYCDNFAAASFRFAKAANHYSFGEQTEGNADLSIGNDYYSEAQNYEVRDLTDIERLLGG